MRAGTLRFLIDIQQRGSTQTAAGDQDSWANATTFLAGAYANIEPKSGRELIAGMAVQDEATHIVTMRYAPGITADMRVKYGTRYFNIVSPPRDTGELNEELVFEVQEGLVSG